MLITISGTPGTGKTSAAKIVAKKLKAKLIITDYLVKKYKIKSTLDKKRKTRIIDTKKLSAAAKMEKDGITILEGHLSNFTGADVSIVLRTSPAELERRLKKKGWNLGKIRENVEAEAIGVISSEARDATEINTTKKRPEQVAAAIIKILKSDSARKRKKMDWTREYKKFLVN